MEKPQDKIETTALIIDDQQAMRKIVSAVVRSLGVSKVYEACDGLEGLRLLTKHNLEKALDHTGKPLPYFNFVICDWNMPNMTGIELLKRIRSNEDLNKIPFFMLTAEHSNEQVLEAIKHGVTDYIVKPFSAQILQSKLKPYIAQQL